jgi:hypothetical protein
MSLLLAQTRCAERDTSPLPNRLDDDSNDGVRINIWPFAQAGILRKTPNESGSGIVSLQFAVVHEAPADFQTATELADRVLVEGKLGGHWF